MTYRRFPIPPPIVSALAAVLIAPPQRTVANQPDGQIQLVGRMRVARSVATATAISGDRVLIAGGMVSGGGSIREFEVFDPSMNRVVAAGQMDEARAGHSATRLADGRVLILGGYNGDYLKSATMFDPQTSTFASAGSMNVGRSGHTATLLTDGTVLIAGGVGDGWSFLSSAEIYDPRTGRFRMVGSMTAARESHTATLLPDGRVLITGGHRDRRENIVVYASTDIYDPSTGQFSAGPSLTIARHKHEAIRLADGRVLIVGGSDPRDRVRFTSAEICDPVGGCRAIAPMRIARYKLRDTALRLRDGRILVAASGRVAEMFDPLTNTFRLVQGDFGAQYAFATSVLLDGGSALVMGGYDDAMHITDGIWRFRE